MIFWLGIAALIVALLSLFISNIFIQTAVFVALSAFLLTLTRPFVEKFVTKNDNKIVTNAYSVIGKTGEVIKPTNSTTQLSQIKVGTETWTAKEKDNISLNEKDIVKVEGIDGVKAIVSKV